MAITVKKFLENMRSVMLSVKIRDFVSQYRYIENVHFSKIEYIICVSQAFRDFKCMNTLEIS